MRESGDRAYGDLLRELVSVRRVPGARDPHLRASSFAFCALSCAGSIVCYLSTRTWLLNNDASMCTARIWLMCADCRVRRDGSAVLKGLCSPLVCFWRNLSASTCVGNRRAAASLLILLVEQRIFHEKKIRVTSVTDRDLGAAAAAHRHLAGARVVVVVVSNLC